MIKYEKNDSGVHFEYKGGWIASLVITIIYSILAYTVDRAPIGPDGTEVGFSRMNGTVAGIFGYNSLFDKITDVTMILAILTAAAFACFGFAQLLKGKSLAKVDKRIIGLGCVYVIVMVLYVAFDKIPINYRPVLVPGETELETSFPSSHVMVICTIMSTAIAFIKSFLAGKSDKEQLRKGLIKAAELIMFIAVVGRIIAGVHWISDIIGGLLISSTITEFYKSLFTGEIEDED